jgi:hypothetical protein
MASNVPTGERCDNFNIQMKDEIKEHIAVLGVGFGSVSLSFVDIEHAFRILILIGSAIYVWRKALRRRKNKKEETDY